MTPLWIEGGLLFTSGRIAYGSRTLELRHLLLDTGSAASVFSADVLFDVGLVPRPEDQIRRIRGVGGTEFVFARRIDRLEVGDLSLGDFEIEVGALDYGFRMDGLVGLDFLAASGAVLDLGRMELRLDPPSALSVMSLFDDQLPAASADDPAAEAGTPLAERMRPRSLAEVVGQGEVAGAEGFLARAIAADRVPSLLFWGPPGSGKTTLARIIARETRARFVPFSAVTTGIKEVKELMAEAARLRRSGQRTLVFVDEIHRFNRAQQDAFLPYVERGDIVLVGATTENPSFEVNAALLSRCRVVVLQPLAPEALVDLARRALSDPERGLGGSGVALSDEALAELAQLASGDARRALNLLEAVVADAAEARGGEGGGDVAAPLGAGSRAALGADAVRRVAQRKVLLYDKSGEEHFNVISALHKSLRESDADAALYWLARQLAAGEEPLYVARRLVRFASEDVGLADPHALVQALAAWDAFHRLGSPEGELALAQAVLYLALAPKSNAAYVAWGEARRTVEERPADPVPMAIRNAPTRLMKDTGYGAGYVYAHDTEEGVGGIECLPESLAGTRFYRPVERGFERELGKRLDHFRRLCAEARARREGGGEAP